MRHAYIRPRLGLSACAAISLTAIAVPAQAQSASEIDALRQELAELKAEHQQSARRIADLEAALAKVAPAGSAALPSPPPAPQPVAVATAPAAMTTPRLALSGDVRLRYESNSGDQDARNRDRGVLRARLRARYAVNDWLAVGGQIATGDPDDPNSTDITLSNFDDDLQVSLDQVYAQANFGALQITGGKIPQPFTRTELVWDGDVSPQGLSASYRLALPDAASLRASGLYFLVDEAVAGPDSRMIGGQLAFEGSLAEQWSVELAAAYYDYRLRSLAGGDTGDFRSNRFANGRYLSDYDLLDLIGAVTWKGLGELWPIRVVGDYVHNFGAPAGINSGHGIDLLIGRSAHKGDWRFGYGYARAENDAILAAFSQDNSNIGSNYLQHSLSIDYMPADRLTLNATFYHYRPLDPAYAGSNDPRDWLDRLRLNILVAF